MAIRLVSDGFIAAFREHIRNAQSLRVASAWLSDNDALKALVSRSGIKVKAIIGTYGTSTDPAALKDLVDRFGHKSLRIVAPPELYHPKLFLFEKQDRTVAWIGSANFTKGGVKTNTELVLETDQARTVAPLEKWFDDQWLDLKGQKVAAAIREYEKRWQAAPKERGKEGDPLRDLVEGREMPLVAGEIRIHPEPKARNRFPGEFQFADGQREAYDSIADGLRRLLRRLAEGRDEFFENCARKPAYNKGRNEDRKRRLIKCNTKERARPKLAVRPQISITRLADSETDGEAWWLSEDTNTPGKWAMTKAAVEVFNEMSGDGRQLTLLDESLNSWPGTI